MNLAKGAIAVAAGLAMVAGATQSAAQPAADAAPLPRTTSIPVGRCINIGNTFESPQEAAWGGRVLADADLSNIAAAGFHTIRLPVRWDTHAAETAPYAIDAAYMERVRHVVETARAAGLNVILNSHHFELIHRDPAAAAPRLAAFWRQIATAFADMPRDHVWFELENEPHGNFTHANLLATLNPALTEIRRTNPDRPVIFGGENWSGVDSLATLPLPDDNHIIPTFHYYEPFDFTHQGATWVDPAPPLGRTYGTAADRARLIADVAKVQAFVARTGLTPFMGETGAHTTAPIEQRVQYHRAIREGFAPIGIDMCQWAYANTFAFYDSDARRWQPGMLSAIGLAEQ
jgi:endoglucanase